MAVIVIQEKTEKCDYSNLHFFDIGSQKKKKAPENDSDILMVKTFQSCITASHLYTFTIYSIHIIICIHISDWKTSQT